MGLIYDHPSPLPCNSITFVFLIIFFSPFCNPASVALPFSSLPSGMHSVFVPSCFRHRSIFEFETFILCVFRLLSYRTVWLPHPFIFLSISHGRYVRSLSLQHKAYDILLDQSSVNRGCASDGAQVLGEFRSELCNLTRPPLSRDHFTSSHFVPRVWVPDSSYTMSCNTAAEIQEGQGESALMTSGSDFSLFFDSLRDINWFPQTEKPKYDRSNVCVKCKERSGNIVIRHVVYCKLSSTFAFVNLRDH